MTTAPVATYTGNRPRASASPVQLDTPRAAIAPGDLVTILPPYKGVDVWTNKTGRVLAVEPLFAPGEASTRILTALLELDGIDDGFYFRLSRLAPAERT